ncbi:MAG: ABC transporter ATP-binding protein, partial [Bacteroidota bacterium]
ALRVAVGNKLQRLSLGYYKKRDPGELASVALQDVNNFEQIFGHSLSNLATAVFGTVVLAVFLVVLDWRLGLTLLGALLFVLPLAQFGQWLVRKYGARAIGARTDTNARLLEYFQGMPHLKSFGMIGASFGTLDDALRNLRTTSIRTEAIPGPVILTAGVVLELFFVLMVWLGLFLLSGGELKIPVMVAFLILGYRLYEPLKISMVEYGVLSYMNVSLERIISLLKAEEQSAGQDAHPSTYDVELDRVTFGYAPERNVLENVSLTARAGEMTALVGPSGSGKTTITSLIARFWDIEEGAIRIGGVDLRNMSTDTVYGIISEVFQEVYLFDGTIYENILVGNPDASPERVRWAAEKAQLTEFTDRMEGGLQTRVGEGGNRLSGGQKQRVSIARALLKDAPIVLLDEATSSLDPENEIYIQRAIQSLVKNKTVIVIAHRLSTISNADQIVVLQDKAVAEAGSHADLMSREGIYHRMWTLQDQASAWEVGAAKSGEHEDSVEAGKLH